MIFKKYLLYKYEVYAENEQFYLYTSLYIVIYCYLHKLINLYIFISTNNMDNRSKLP